MVRHIHIHRSLLWSESAALWTSTSAFASVLRAESSEVGLRIADAALERLAIRAVGVLSNSCALSLAFSKEGITLLCQICVGHSRAALTEEALSLLEAFGKAPLVESLHAGAPFGKASPFALGDPVLLVQSFSKAVDLLRISAGLIQQRRDVGILVLKSIFFIRVGVSVHLVAKVWVCLMAANLAPCCTRA